MKKLMLALTILALSAAGCRQPAGDKPRIGVAMRGFEGAFRSGSRRAIETEAASRAELTVSDGLSQQTVQDGQIEAFIADKARSLAVDLVSPGAAASVIEKAKAAKAPLVFFGKRPTKAEMTSWDKAYYVGGSPEEAGSCAGRILAKWWAAHPAADANKDGKMSLAILASLPGNQETGHRAEAAIKALEAAGVSVDLFPDPSAPGSNPQPAVGRSPRAVAQTPRSRAASLFSKGGDSIEALLCEEEALALGAIEALAARDAAPAPASGAAKGAGAKSASGTTRPALPVVSAEAATAGLEAIGAGALVGAAVDNASSIGLAVFRLALVLARGQDAAAAGYAVSDAKYVWVPCREITATNLSDASK